MYILIVTISFWSMKYLRCFVDPKKKEKELIAKISYFNFHQNMCLTSIV